MAASPLRLYHAQSGSGSLRGIGIGLSPPVSLEARVLRTRSPLADHRMPWVTQKLGTIVKTQRRWSPQLIVIGIYCRVKTIAVPRAPNKKWMKSVTICALISD